MVNRKDIVRKKKGEVIREAKISEKDGSKSKDIGKRNPVVVILLMAMIILCVFFFLLHWNLDSGDLDSMTKTSKDFKKQYEELNHQKDKAGNSYLNLSIDSDNIVQYATYDKIFSILERGTGIIYFGTPESNPSRALLPILFDASDEVGIDTIYYLDVSDDQDQRELGENGKIVNKKEGTQSYQKLVNKLNSVLGSYDGLEDDSIKRIYFPTLIFVKDGEIIESYIGSSDSKNNVSTLMDGEASRKLKEELMSYMNQIITCDDAC